MASHEMSITDAEVLAGFAEALGYDGITDDPNAQTVRQLAAAFGCCREAAKRRARKAVEAGRLEVITVRRDTGNGMREMEAYRLIAPRITPETGESRHDFLNETEPQNVWG